MEDILMMCKDVVKLGQFDDMDCIHDGCGTCPFSPCNNDGFGCGADTDENYIKIAQEYIDKHEPKNKFKIGDIVTGVNKSQWLSNGNYKIVNISSDNGEIRYGVNSINGEPCIQDCVWKEYEMKLSNNYKNTERNDNMKKTFTQVVTTIKEDEVWESEEKTIKLNSFNQLVIEVKTGFEGAITGTQRMALDLDRKYTLQRKQYDFIEAFKAYEEGFEIEDMHGCKFKKIDGVDSYKLKCDNNFTGKSDDTDFWFGFEEIRGKWYISK